MTPKMMMMCCFVLCSGLALGCVEDDSLEGGYVVSEGEARGGGGGNVCPGGWYDAAVVNIRCEAGYELDYKNFKGTTCVTCSPVSDGSSDGGSCKGSWKDINAEILCAPGYDFEYNRKGTCKRCAAVDAECSSDADCRAFSNYCGGCGCEALSSSEGDTCTNPDTQCFVDPCMDLTAACVNSQCTLVDAPQ